MRWSTLHAAACVLERPVDLVLRLKAALPPAEQMARVTFKRALRAEADGLLDACARELPARAAAASRSSAPEAGPPLRPST